MFSTDYPFQRLGKEQAETFLGEFATDADRQSFMSGYARRLFKVDGVGSVP
jgi:hypothetical protein